jgi:primosomal protein N' (replication factor Y) (superfamily II helicase)
LSKYAQVIIDISYEKLDKTFDYLIPDALEEKVSVGTRVQIPFGNRKHMTGYVVGILEEPDYDKEKCKPITDVVAGSLPIESQLIALAAWMRRNYGATMNQALKTVIPVKTNLAKKDKRILKLSMNETDAKELLATYQKRHYAAKARLLEVLLEKKGVPYEFAGEKLHVQAQTIRAMEGEGVLCVCFEKASWRDPLPRLEQEEKQIVLNEEQRAAVDAVLPDVREKRAHTWLLYGVTGSGKTEVYMELIAQTVAMGREAIMLIPEIALTYQTVKRFYQRFGNRISVIHSKMSPGERYDQFERAKRGEIDVMIGPRSALFTPFSNLGIIIIDEEHEGSYKSENVPRYHARETAIERARMCHAPVVLGSATPSVESFYKAKNNEYGFVSLTKRVSDRSLADCEIVDLRTELKEGNRSILSNSLQNKMEERLEHGEQTMLFLNRRGRLSFVSCRACGEVIKCPHCDVSLSLHNNGIMRCHYCGYETMQPTSCPSCGSKYISGFRAGTQKIEELVQKRFPKARILRMDADTTKKKNSYEEILSAFANKQADVLVGTQMIVKGHDFPNVTLVGVLAADLSLYGSDYRASERTFELLTQAAGRAGRGEKNGEVVIQTYQPDHYSIVCAAEQNYERFYEEEIAYRSLMRYPPIWHMLVILCASKDEKKAEEGINRIFSLLKEKKDGVSLIGPADATVAKINDIYRKVLYLKHADYAALVRVKDVVEEMTITGELWKDVLVRFDFDPMNAL